MGLLGWDWKWYYFLYPFPDAQCTNGSSPYYDPSAIPNAPKSTENGKDSDDGQTVVKPKVCPKEKVGDPITITTGNNYESVTDISLQAPGGSPFSLKRFYNSRSERVGSSGHGWSHSYSSLLDPTYEHDGSNYLMVEDETGRTVLFQEDGTGLYAGAFGETTSVALEGTDYVWTRTDGRKYAFSPSGRLEWIDDSQGNRITLFYDASERLENVTDLSSGRVITFSYNAQGNVEQISGPSTPAIPDGVYVTYAYDGNGNLVSVLYSDGSGFEYEYTDLTDIHNLTVKRDKAGHILSTWNYDSDDRAVESFTRDGEGVTIDYVSEEEIHVTDAYGVEQTYTLDRFAGKMRVTDIQSPTGCGNCGDDIKRLAYNENRRIIEAEYANGLINQYDNYDARGNPRTVRLAVGTMDEKTVSYTFHPALNQTLSKTEPSVLGPGNKVTTWDFDDDGNATPNENPTTLVHRIVEQGSTFDVAGTVVPYEYITAFTYNEKGQVLSIDGPLAGTQDETTFTYDAVTGDLLTVTRPIVGTTVYADYDAAGLPGTVTDPNGNSVDYTYDGRGRVLTLTRQPGGAVTTFQYNTAGDIERIEQANGVIADYTYDAVYGRLTRITDSLGNTIEYSYDAQGNRTEQGFYNPSGERQFWMRFDYQGPDAPGKLWKEIYPDDTYTGYAYNASGDVSSIVDAAGWTTEYLYDIQQRLSNVIQPGDLTTAYDYDGQGNLSVVTDAENLTTVYTYDDMGRRVSETSPDTGTTLVSFDAAGNRISKTDANGVIVSYSYDALGRLTGVSYPDSDQNITYTYDEGLNGIGRLTGMTDPSGTTTFQYDAEGRLVEEARTIDGVAYITGYAYDAAGLPTGMTYPDGRVVTNERDGAGRVVRVTTTLNGSTRVLADNIAYKPYGPLADMALGDGTLVSRTFDERYRLTDQTSGAVLDRGYTFDPVGNITGISDNIDPLKSRTFGYDDLYRLTSATGPFGAIDYTYDNVGNRLTRDENNEIDTYWYASGSHRLSEITGTNPVLFDYDANGNTVVRGESLMEYSQDNRLVSVVENGIVQGEYVYNGMNQRTIKTVDGQSTHFIYDLQGQLIAESDSTGRITREYVYLDGRLLATMDASSMAIEADITVSPKKMWFWSWGRWLKVIINLPDNYDVKDIDRASIRLNGELAPKKTWIKHYRRRKKSKLIALFKRREVLKLLGEPGQFDLVITGQVNGTPFKGEDKIKIINPWWKRWKKTAKSKSSVSQPSQSAGNVEGTIYFYHLDHLGTPLVITNDRGEIVWQADYQPFGTAEIQFETISNNIRFPGQHYDVETSLHYNYHRYYDPTTGRYLTPDPIGLAGGINPYVYANLNPFNVTDALGLLMESYYSGLGYGQYDVDFGGIWAAPPPVYNPAANIMKDKVILGVTGTLLTKDYSLSTKPNIPPSRSSNLLGGSIDMTIGDRGSSEVGVGWRHLGAGVEIGEDGIKGFSLHLGASLPPSVGYGRVSDMSKCPK